MNSLPLFRKLKNNHSNCSPSTLIFFDTETIPCDISTVNKSLSMSYPKGTKLNKLRLGVAIAGRLENNKWTREKLYRFKTPDDFWDILQTHRDRKRPIWIFAHNLGFDFRVCKLPERIRSKELLIKLIDPKTSKQKHGKWIDEDPPTILEVFTVDGCKLLFVDTLNYWRTSVESIGKAYGVKKAQMPEYEDDDEKWFTYCEQDVRVLKHSVLSLISWIKQDNLGRFRFSAASQAMGTYRHRFMKTPIILHEVESAKLIERSSYYGGRFEAFYLGTPSKTDHKRYYLYDITSMYPFVMKNKLYPYCIQTVKLNPENHVLSNLYSHKKLAERTIATVKINSDSETYPLRTDKGLVFAKGSFVTTLAGPELCRALKNHHVSCLYCYSTYLLTDLFSGYVDYFWTKRLQAKQCGDTVQSDLCKLFLNSLYGKFGQKSPQWCDEPEISAKEDEFCWTIIDAQTLELKEFRAIGELVQQKVKRVDHPQSFCAIASYVTAYAREYLLELIKCSGWKNTFYVATDSLIVNQQGKENLEKNGYIDQDVLGKLKLVEQSETLEIKALHQWSMDNTSRKGSRKKSAEWIGENTVRETIFESLPKSLQNEPLGGVITYPREKTFSYLYHKGLSTDSGWIEPITIQDK